MCAEQLLDDDRHRVLLVACRRPHPRPPWHRGARCPPHRTSRPTPASGCRWACRRSRRPRPRSMPCDAASSARPVALVTPGAAISSSPNEDEWVTVPRPPSRTSARVRKSSTSHAVILGQQLQHRPVGDLGQRSQRRRRDRVAAAVGRRVDLPVVDVVRFGGEAVQVLDGEVDVRERRAQISRDRVHDVGLEQARADDLLGLEVVEHRTVRTDGDAPVPAGLDDVVEPARRPAGDEGDQQSGFVRGGDRRLGARRDRAVPAQQRAVQIGRKEPDQGVSNSLPPSHGRSAAGTYTEPSGCWWWSSRHAIVRATAHSVPLRVATCSVPRSVRVRMLSRRAWNVVQFEVDVSSRYAPCDGNHASMSNLRDADDPRSPAATSMTR